MPDPALDEEPRTILTGRLRGSTVGILVIVTLIAFESMAVSTALPTAAREVHGLAGYGWAFTGFLVANIVGMVVAGELTDRRGAPLPLAAGLASFVVGLALAGTATTMAQLVAGRVVQGVGSGFMITAIYVVVGEAYPERLRPAIFAAFSSAWVVPGLVGPLLSGFVTQHLTWRLVFLALVPFCLVGGVLLVPALRALTRPDPPTAGRGGRRLLLALAVAGGVAALEGAGQHPSASCSSSPSRASPSWSGACAACCRRAPSSRGPASRHRSRCAGCWPARSSASSRCCRSP